MALAGIVAGAVLATTVLPLSVSEASGVIKGQPIEPTNPPSPSFIRTFASGTVRVGEKVRDIATLSGGTGWVVFKLFGPNNPGCFGPADFIDVEAASSTVSSQAFTVAAPGTYQWVASYSGDKDFFASIAPCGDPAEQVEVLPLPGMSPVFTAASPPVGATVCTAYSYNFTARGDPAPTFSVASGVLPTGLTLSSTGLLSGTPTAGGSFTFAVRAANGISPNAVTPNITITVDADYCVPFDWDAYSKPNEPNPGPEPLNVIISAASDVM